MITSNLINVISGGKLIKKAATSSSIVSSAYEGLRPLKIERLPYMKNQNSDRREKQHQSKKMAGKSGVLVMAMVSVMAVVAMGVGGWEPIENLQSDHKVISYTNFAVATHNKEKSVSLVPLEVIKAEKEIVAGLNYRIVFSAKDADATNTYTAVVFIPLDKKPLKLVSFDKSN